MCQAHLKLHQTGQSMSMINVAYIRVPEKWIIISLLDWSSDPLPVPTANSILSEILFFATSWKWLGLLYTMNVSLPHSLQLPRELVLIVNYFQSLLPSGIWCVTITGKWLWPTRCTWEDGWLALSLSVASRTSMPYDAICSPSVFWFNFSLISFFSDLAVDPLWLPVKSCAVYSCSSASTLSIMKCSASEDSVLGCLWLKWLLSSSS